ncbi:MAG TPA: hypothetical protein V6D17_21050 [Candidatus Obscuribacterales bacterium]
MTGHEFAEMAPALFILLVCILPPMIDLIYLGIAYAAAWYLNHLQVREAACAPPGQEAAACDRAKAAWQGSTLAAFIKGTESAAPVIAKQDKFPPAPPPGADPDTIQVTTTVTVAPFLQIPFLGSVPGIGAPITWRISSERTREEVGLN